MRYRLVLLLMLMCMPPAASAQIDIGINFSLFPELVRVPNYPVYYAPRQNAKVSPAGGAARAPGPEIPLSAERRTRARARTAADANSARAFGT